MRIKAQTSDSAATGPGTGTSMSRHTHVDTHEETHACASLHIKGSEKRGRGGREGERTVEVCVCARGHALSMPCTTIPLLSTGARIQIRVADSTSLPLGTDAGMKVRVAR
eukprot:2029495-Rhodomonas_salina.2